MVHAHVADLMIVPIKDRDLVRLLEHLHSPIPKNVGHGFGPTLVAGVGAPTPLTSISPCFLTTSAAAGFKTGLV
jgi:hypothetical protein